MLDLAKVGWDIKAMGDVNHQIVAAPYIRIDSFKQCHCINEYVFKYDLRFTQPNKRFMNLDVIHSLEHFLLVGYRKRVEGFIGVAPMGCLTGFYLFLLNDFIPAKIIADFESILHEILIANEVPLSTDITCGHASNHDLEGAKEMTKEILAEKGNWLNVFKN